MTIVPSDEVIGMSNYIKNWLDIFKNKDKIRIWIFGKIFEIVNICQRLRCDTKEKLGGVILKSLSLGTGCTDFAQMFF